MICKQQSPSNLTMLHGSLSNQASNSHSAWYGVGEWGPRGAWWPAVGPPAFDVTPLERAAGHRALGLAVRYVDQWTLHRRVVEYSE
jgi:hypothetical protein